MAYSSQENHTGQLDFCNWLADGNTTEKCDYHYFLWSLSNVNFLSQILNLRFKELFNFLMKLDGFHSILNPLREILKVNSVISWPEGWSLSISRKKWHSIDISIKIKNFLSLIHRRPNVLNDYKIIFPLDLSFELNISNLVGQLEKSFRHYYYDWLSVVVCQEGITAGRCLCVNKMECQIWVCASVASWCNI